MFKRIPRTLLQSSVLTLVLMTPPVSDAVEQRDIAPANQNSDGQLMRLVSESWRKGTIDAAFLLNKHLESSTIKVSVSKETATLTGSVGTAIKKNLASEIALSVEGIEKVNNKLTVVPNRTTEISQIEFVAPNRTDALLIAKVNQKLLANQHLQAAMIDVHAHNGMVELSGNTPEASMRDLAYYLTKNVSGVKSVDNKIKVRIVR